MHPQRGVVVVRMVGVHRADQGEVVDAAGDVREQRADLGAALAVAAEFPLRLLEEQFS